MNRRNWFKAVGGGVAGTVLAPKVRAAPAMGTWLSLVRDAPAGSAVGKSYDLQNAVVFMPEGHWVMDRCTVRNGVLLIGSKTTGAITNSKFTNAHYEVVP